MRASTKYIFLYVGLNQSRLGLSGYLMNQYGRDWERETGWRDVDDDKFGCWKMHMLFFLYVSPWWILTDSKWKSDKSF